MLKQKEVYELLLKNPSQGKETAGYGLLTRCPRDSGRGDDDIALRVCKADMLTISDNS